MSAETFRRSACGVSSASSEPVVSSLFDGVHIREFLRRSKGGGERGGGGFFVLLVRFFPHPKTLPKILLPTTCLLDFINFVIVYTHLEYCFSVIRGFRYFRKVVFSCMFATMRFSFSKLIKGDKTIWTIVIALTLISVLAFYSSARNLAARAGNPVEVIVLKHTLHLILGLGIIVLMQFVNFRVFARISFLLLGLAIILLIYTNLQGRAGAINQANRWINIFGFSFQTSDLAKFSLVVHIAKMLTIKQHEIQNFNRGFVPVILWILIICGLIAPSDLSMALLVFLTSIVLIYIGRVRLKYILSLFLIGILGLIILVNTAKRATTWKNRINDYISMMTDPSYEPSYQIIQSHIAIAEGGIIGKGPGKSTQKLYLPNPYDDFVFAIIVEEYGTVGALVVISLYLMFLFRAMVIVTKSLSISNAADDSEYKTLMFGALLSAGLSFLIVGQALINIGVTTGLLPATGLPLPIISKGGTSILFTSLSIGIILNVSKQVMKEKL